MRQPQPMNREARVLRYKEKRKNRKFDKTIRCAFLYSVTAAPF